MQHRDTKGKHVEYVLLTTSLFMGTLRKKDHPGYRATGQSWRRRHGRASGNPATDGVHEGRMANQDKGH